MFVVVSAMSGTTNSLIEISNYLYKKNSDGANDVINNLEQKYMQHVEELYSTDEYKQCTREFLASEFNYLRSFTKESSNTTRDAFSFLPLRRPKNRFSLY